jgi:polyisoprenoid-binding protein YceI
MNRSKIPAIVLAPGILAAAVTARAADTCRIDPVHSFASFSVGHLGIDLVRGSFSEISGTIAFDAADAAKDAIDVTAENASVNRHADKRNEDLRSPNFLEVEKYPTMSFRNTAVAKKDDVSTVTGNSTLHRVTKTITTTARFLGAGKVDISDAFEAVKQ